MSAGSTSQANSDRAWGALAGLRVVDLTQSLSGPFCTQILADHGAVVIKVEPPAGDLVRRAGPYHAADTPKSEAGYFHSINRNKQGIALDLKTEDGPKILMRLIADADILVENYRAGTMEKLGLSYETLSERNPRLIYGVVRGFGDHRTGTSPYLNWPAYDVVAQAMGGICGITGPDAEHPTKIGPGIGDIVPGIFLAVGILAAVVNRQSTGKGQFVDVAMVDSILAITERIVYQNSFAKITPGPQGNHQPFFGPFGLFPTKDGHVALAATTDAFFEKLCIALEAPELLQDPRFKTEAGRGDVKPLIDAVSKLTQRYTKAELAQRLGGRVPFGPVNSIAEIAADPHFAAREMLPRLSIPGIPEPLAVAGTPIKFSRTPGQVTSRGPRLGEHSEAILAAAGYSVGEIAAFRAKGVVK